MPAYRQLEKMSAGNGAAASPYHVAKGVRAGRRSALHATTEPASTSERKQQGEHDPWGERDAQSPPSPASWVCPLRPIGHAPSSEAITPPSATRFARTPANKGALTRNPNSLDCPGRPEHLPTPTRPYRPQRTLPPKRRFSHPLTPKTVDPTSPPSRHSLGHPGDARPSPSR